MKIFIFVFFIFIFSNSNAQNYNNNPLLFFIKRMVTKNPFEGVKVLIDDNGNEYLISVVYLKIDSNRSNIIENRLANIKAKSQASQFINGSNMSSNILIINKEIVSNQASVNTSEIIETLKEISSGFINGLELLDSFVNYENKAVIYIYYKSLNVQNIR
ncbi:MAG: hypothetical protein KA534_06190 [Sediminibacterium sp.]|nr:hypothetical protein [Sediminibacterium sp.]